MIWLVATLVVVVSLITGHWLSQRDDGWDELRRFEAWRREIGRRP